MEKHKQEYKRQIRNYLESYTPDYVDFLKRRYEKYQYICGFGVGNMGSCVPTMVSLLGRKLDFFCDNNAEKTGKKDPYGYGIDVISLKDLLKHKEDAVVLVPTRYYKDIYIQLTGLGFLCVDRVFPNKIWIDDYLRTHDRQEVIDNICNTIDILDDEESCRVLTRIIQEWTTDEYQFGQLDDIYALPQYFQKDIVPNKADEIYVDCGAYTGDDIPGFINYTEGNFKRYYAFELNAESYRQLVDSVSEQWKKYTDRFILVNKGVSDRTEAIHYSENGEGSCMSSEGSTEGEAIALDDYFGDQGEATFIKMDIEGAEMQALRGADKLISQNLPKLAICLYHKTEDIWEIPLYIKQHWSEYKIYIRHHTDLLNETVCYAVKAE